MSATKELLEAAREVVATWGRGEVVATGGRGDLAVAVHRLDAAVQEADAVYLCQNEEDEDEGGQSKTLRKVRKAAALLLDVDMPAPKKTPVTLPDQWESFAAAALTGILTGRSLEYLAATVKDVSPHERLNELTELAARFADHMVVQYFNRFYTEAQS